MSDAVDAETDAGIFVRLTDWEHFEGESVWECIDVDQVVPADTLLAGRVSCSVQFTHIDAADVRLDAAAAVAALVLVHGDLGGRF